jgi:hypothetical protein
MSAKTGTLRLAPDVLFQDLASEAVFLNLKNDRYYGLDEIGTRIWTLLSEQGDLESVIVQMLNEFDTDETTLRRDITALVEVMTQAGLAINDTSASEMEPE